MGGSSLAPEHLLRAAGYQWCMLLDGLSALPAFMSLLHLHCGHCSGHLPMVLLMGQRVLHEKCPSCWSKHGERSEVSVSPLCGRLSVSAGQLCCTLRKCWLMIARVRMTCVWASQLALMRQSSSSVRNSVSFSQKFGGSLLHGAEMELPRETLSLWTKCVDNAQHADSASMNSARFKISGGPTAQILAAHLGMARLFSALFIHRRLL